MEEAAQWVVVSTGSGRYDKKLLAYEREVNEEFAKTA
jgi:hypothetical protein